MERRTEVLRAIEAETRWSWLDVDMPLDDEDLELLAVELDEVRPRRAVRRARRPERRRFGTLVA